MKPSRHKVAPSRTQTGSGSRGFSLIELLVVIAIIGILASLLLPVLGKGKLRAQGVGCMNSHRQLMLAWRMYTDDNHDKLPFASEMPGRWETYDAAWVTGTLTFDGSDPANWDPALTVHKSPLWPYCGKSEAIWKCPADNSYVVTPDGERKPRVRSMSMNIFMGGWGGTYGNWEYTSYAPYWVPFRIFMKQSDVASAGPADMFVFLDMRPDSIDMGNFATKMAGWPNDSANYGFWDLPGFMHHHACGFSFADGHAEIRRWRDGRTSPPLHQNGGLNDHFYSPHNADVGWLQERSTRPK